MANSNPQAVLFANTQIRPMADLIASAYLSAKKIVDAWNSQALSSVIPNDANLIVDGSAVDGRPPMTDAQATNIITRSMELISWLENGLVASPFNASATLATLNTVMAVEVNGQTKF